jgi:antitoxin component of RelBE/YafQ-DinJ toxin-antitoxin module
LFSAWAVTSGAEISIAFLACEARRVTEEIGTTPGEVVRLLFVQLVKRRAIPFPLQADSPEDELLGSAERRSKMWDAFNKGKPAARSSLDGGLRL